MSNSRSHQSTQDYIFSAPLDQLTSTTMRSATTTSNRDMYVICECSDQMLSILCISAKQRSAAVERAECLYEVSAEPGYHKRLSHPHWTASHQTCMISNRAFISSTRPSSSLYSHTCPARGRCQWIAGGGRGFYCLKVASRSSFMQREPDEVNDDAPCHKAFVGNRARPRSTQGCREQS